MQKDILVVDDCAVTKASFQSILQDTYTVFFSETAHEGLDALAGNIGLVFLGLSLPDADGIEVLGRIKEDYPSIPVIITASHGTEETCIAAFRRGARDYIKKPLDPEEVLYRTALFTKTNSTRQRHRHMSLDRQSYEDKRFQGIPSRVVQGILKVKNSTFADRNIEGNGVK